MSTKYQPPIISVELDEHDHYVLMATSHGYTERAGERLFRAEPHPRIRWRHAVLDEAETDAATLRAYLAECAGAKRQDEPVAADLRNYWNE